MDEGGLGIFKNLNTELLKRIVIMIEMTWVMFMAILYWQFHVLFSLFSIMLLVAHLITIIGLPSVFSKLNTERREESLHFAGAEEREEGVHDVDLWDRAVVGFYVLTNAGVILVLSAVLLSYL